MSTPLNKVTGFFKSRPKLTKILGIAALVIIALIASGNEKVSSFIRNVRGVAEVVSGAESSGGGSGSSAGGEANLDELFGPVTTDYSTTNRSTAPSSSTGYSTTTEGNLWNEIRDGYEDGDQAAEAERRAQEEWLRSIDVKSN